MAGPGADRADVSAIGPQVGAADGRVLDPNDRVTVELEFSVGNRLQPYVPWTVEDRRSHAGTLSAHADKARPLADRGSE